MSTQGRDAEFATRLYALVREMIAQTESPVVLDAGVQMLGLAKVLLTEAAPDAFEHVRLEREPVA
jgi:hypothetical protein